MPGEDRLRRDEERRPAVFWHETSELRDELTICPGEAGTGDLAAQPC